MAVLLSGSGRTLDNFHDRIRAGTLQAEIQVVISSAADALGLEKARKYGYPAFHAVGNPAVNEILGRYDIELVALAGYLKLYEPPPHLLRAVLNIHPSLIPSFCGPGFYGHHVHEAVKAAGEKESGITIHLVNEHYDKGSIIFQKTVALDPGDDPDDIAAKVHQLEYEYFPKVIEDYIQKYPAQ